MLYLLLGLIFYLGLYAFVIQVLQRIGMRNQKVNDFLKRIGEEKR